MENLTQIEIIGGVVIGLAAILALLKYFNEHIEKQNAIYTKFNENLIKCTMAIDNLNNYIEKMEKDVKETLSNHEKRLDEHQEAIIRLSHYKEIKIDGGKEDD